MKINFVNGDHVHALVDLPTDLTIERMMQLFKGGSSHWINESDLISGKFAWGRGYGVFSVSHSGVDEVAHYIAGQEEHHRKRGFSEELKLFVEKYGLKWCTEETVKTYRFSAVTHNLLRSSAFPSAKEIVSNCAAGLEIIFAGACEVNFCILVRPRRRMR